MEKKKETERTSKQRGEERNKGRKASKQTGGGGFFLKCEDLGSMFDNSFRACAFFFEIKLELSQSRVPPLPPSFPYFWRITFFPLLGLAQDFRNTVGLD